MNKVLYFKREKNLLRSVGTTFLDPPPFEMQDFKKYGYKWRCRYIFCYLEFVGFKMDIVWTYKWKDKLYELFILWI